MKKKKIYCIYVSWALWPVTQFVHLHNSCRPPPTSEAAGALLGSACGTDGLGRAYARDDLFVDVVLVDKYVRECEEAIKDGLGKEGAQHTGTAMGFGGIKGRREDGRRRRLAARIRLAVVNVIAKATEKRS